MQECNKVVRRREQGFTLVELMVVVAIIAILAAIAVPKLTAFLKNAHTAAATENMGRIAQYMEGKQSINAGFADGSTYYVAPRTAAGAAIAGVPATGDMSRVIGVELEVGHEWVYFARADVNATNTKVIDALCILAVNKDGNGTAAVVGAGRYILYSKKAISSSLNWEGNFWKLAYLSDGQEFTDNQIAGSDCVSANFPVTTAVTIP